MPGYQVRLQHVSVTGGDGLKVRSLLDKQQFSDPLGEAAAAGISAATWPLFGQLWPSSEKLADIMQTWSLDGVTVLEIGCGLALASMVVHRRLGDVTASDCHPLAEPFLQANLRLNALPALKYQTGHWSRENESLGCFDLIIGGDVLYERGHPEDLAGFIALHVNAVAEVLIIDPNRGHRSAFNKHMANNGFVLTETPIIAPMHDGTAYRGKQLHYRRGIAAESS